MAYADQQTSGNRVVAIILVALIHVFVGYLFISGLAFSDPEQLALAKLAILVASALAAALTLALARIEPKA